MYVCVCVCVCVCNIYKSSTYNYRPVVEAARMPYYMRIVKGDRQGWIERFGMPPYIFFFTKKTERRMLCFVRGILACYIDK